MFHISLSKAYIKRLPDRHRDYRYAVIAHGSPTNPKILVHPFH